jgi:hypothetical protein
VKVHHEAPSHWMRHSKVRQDAPHSVCQNLAYSEPSPKGKSMSAYRTPHAAALTVILLMAAAGLTAGCAEPGGDSAKSTTGGPLLRTPRQAEFYPEARVQGKLRLDSGCLSLDRGGQLAIAIWPTSAEWDESTNAVSMTANGSTSTYRVGSLISDAVGGYYEDFGADAPRLIGRRVWSEAVKCASKVGAKELVLIAPPMA